MIALSGLNCVLSNSCAEAITFNVTAFGDGTFKKVFKVK